jgi:clusterin-associated protein 1
MADSATKLSNLRTGRQLAIEITKAGADLYDLLDKEPDLRDIRVLSVAKQLEMNELETEIKRQIQLVNENINHTRKGVEDLLADEANLKAKIERKRQELERREKRLRSLQGVR